MDAVYDHRGVERLRRVAELSPLPRTLAATAVVEREERV
jgi:hypothetical protein